MSRKQGLFISVEGIDGAGKSTQLVTVREWAYSKGWDVSDVVSVREPGGTPLGEKIRALFLEAKEHDLTSPLQDAMLLLIAKKALWESVVYPAIHEGKVVVADRWTDTLYAYQGYGFGLHLPQITRLIETVEMDYWPDATIWLDTPINVCRQRMDKERAANQQNALDKKGVDFFSRVRSCYEHRWIGSVGDSRRIIRVDGDGRENAVAELIREALDKRFAGYLG